MRIIATLLLLCSPACAQLSGYSEAEVDALGYQTDAYWEAYDWIVGAMDETFQEIYELEEHLDAMMTLSATATSDMQYALADRDKYEEGTAIWTHYHNEYRRARRDASYANAQITTTQDGLAIQWDFIEDAQVSLSYF